MEDGPRKRQRIVPPESGPYLLRSVLDDIPLQNDETVGDVSITCVEHWNGNLYIGTSASELLHLVAIPPENDNQPVTYILASRLQPSGQAATPPAGQARGVLQIVVLPGAAKACVLCNGVVSFYTLPELSPASPTREPTGVLWIGGLDENEEVERRETHDIMIATARRVMIIQVGEKYKLVKNVDYPGCLRASRRETVACVANESSYALLEVEHEQQIPLVPISTVRPELEVRQASPSGHSRSTSLGNPLLLSPSTLKSNGNNLEVPESEKPSRSPSTGETPMANRPRSSTDSSPTQVTRRPQIAKLKPHILSPGGSEFMLTTGTVKSEPGVGTFFNLDGDPSRGTIEFQRYPDALLIYDFDILDATEGASDRQSVLALLDKTDTPHEGLGIEIQELSSAVFPAAKTWISLPQRDPATRGLHQCLTQFRHSFSEVVGLLGAVRYKPKVFHGAIEADPRTKASIKRLEQETALFDDQSSQAASPTPEYEQKRSEEETKFAELLSRSSTRALIWAGDQLWQILPSPLVCSLEARLLRTGLVKHDEYSFDSIDISQVLSLLGSIRDHEPRSEADALSLNYIRQKAGLVLFLHLQNSLERPDLASACQIVQNALLESSIDPRFVLLLVPPLAREVIQGHDGLWTYQGIVEALAVFNSKIVTFEDAPIAFWFTVRNFLGEWQERRDYGSVANDKYLCDSVDVALLHVLLYLDQAQPERNRAETKTKLEYVIDHWKADLHRAVLLLQHYQRLFLLSRLYASRKLSKDVLATWKRIAEGEADADKSLTVQTVEQHVRKYLTKISNVALVQEYALWLAHRNVDLAVQVFADDNSRAKFTPEKVVATLKEHAPGAVQQYLEHLVFGKHLDQYADDLIGYYLDSVLSVLESSPTERDSLEQSYTAYRALEAPKPTYLNFITHNSPPQPWWQSRLRLLQLLGSGGYAAAASSSKELTYSVDKVLERLRPFSSYLVSESIILDARQGRHKEALDLLTHGLGDYDTAIRYCYFGGPAPISSQPIDADALPSREVQKDLFNHLFSQFLQIDDVEERLERTSHLLGNFAAWYDPLAILQSIPEEWTINVISEFLLRSLRAATTERNEAVIIKALSATQNLQAQAAYIDLCEKHGPRVEHESTSANTAVLDADVAVI